MYISAARFHSGVHRLIGLKTIAIDISNAQPSELPYGTSFHIQIVSILCMLSMMDQNQHGLPIWSAGKVPGKGPGKEIS